MTGMGLERSGGKYLEMHISVGYMSVEYSKTFVRQTFRYRRNKTVCLSTPKLRRHGGIERYRPIYQPITIIIIIIILRRTTLLAMVAGYYGVGVGAY